MSIYKRMEKNPFNGNLIQHIIISSICIKINNQHTVVKEEMAIPSQLLEHVCQRIASRIFKDFPTVEALDIRLYKENPPMGACARNIGVEVHYVR